MTERDPRTEPRVFQWCAECGKPMQRREDGAWSACCLGRGYWTRTPPLFRDQWWQVLKRKGFVFYPGPKWPPKMRPVTPTGASE